MKKFKYKVGIIGLGYVGLPLAIRFCSEDFTVIGFDVDEKKVNILQDGGSYIEHIEKTEWTQIWITCCIYSTC